MSPDVAVSYLDRSKIRKSLGYQIADGTLHVEAIPPLSCHRATAYLEILTFEN